MKIRNLLLILLLGAFVMSSCTVQRNQFTPGYRPDMVKRELQKITQSVRQGITPAEPLAMMRGIESMTNRMGSEDMLLPRPVTGLDALISRDHPSSQVTTGAIGQQDSGTMKDKVLRKHDPVRTESGKTITEPGKHKGDGLHWTGIVGLALVLVALIALLGGASFLTVLVLAFLGIIFSAISISKTPRGSGKGVGVIGVIMGILVILVVVALIALLIWFIYALLAAL